MAPQFVIDKSVVMVRYFDDFLDGDVDSVLQTAAQSSGIRIFVQAKICNLIKSVLAYVKGSLKMKRVYWIVLFIVVAGCGPGDKVPPAERNFGANVSGSTKLEPTSKVRGFSMALNIDNHGDPIGTKYSDSDAFSVADYLSSGAVWVEDDICFIGTGDSMTGIVWNGPLPTMNYEVTLDAKRVEGRDFFCGLTFPYNDDPCTLIVGGWGGGLVGISSLDGMDASENSTSTWREFENDRWYTIRLRVTPDKIQAWIDEDQVVDVETEGHDIGIRFEVEQCRPFGIATYRTTSAIKNVRIRAFEEGRA